MEGCVKKLGIVAFVMALAIVSNPELANGDGFCRMSTEGFRACKTSVSGPNPDEPSTLCCSALANADPACLCFYMKNYPGLLSVYHVDPSLALQLPDKCKLGDSFHC